MSAAKVVLGPREREPIRQLVQASGFPTEEPEDQHRFNEMVDALYFRIDPSFTLPVEGLMGVLKECLRDGLVPTDFKLESVLRLKALEAAKSSFH